MKRLLRGIIHSLGFDIVRHHRAAGAAPLPPDVSPEDAVILRRVAGYTMTSLERQISLIHAVRYLVRRGIGGSFVECGVWRGGSAMAVALTLLQEGETSRDLYLFDTFEGMSPPTEADKSWDGTPAEACLARDREGTGAWCYATLEEVRANMASTQYPQDRIHFVKGPVEETIPAHSPPPSIALLRLDTDWYASTRHEMHHLFPLLREGGILIIDDYGYWDGARKAIDEYLSGEARSYYLHRIDDTGRLLLKQ